MAAGGTAEEPEAPENDENGASLEEVAKRRREVTRKAAAKTVGEQQRRVVVETGDGDVRSVRRVRGDRPVQGTGDGAARGEVRATNQPAKPDEERGGGAKPHGEGTARRVRFAVDGHNGVCAGTTAAPVAGRKTAVDGDDATRRVVIDLACASVVQTKEEQAEVVAQQLDAWMTQFGADVAPDEVVGSTKKRDEEDEGGSPESVQQAMATETGRRDPAKAKVLRVKAAEVLQRAAQAEVEARQLHRRQKRKLREHERRERRAARASRESEHVVEVVRAAVVPDKGHDELVVEAAMLVTSTGPVVTPSSDEFVRESRTKRRYEKLARKARAREDRKLREWLAAQQYPEGTYMAFADVKRRHGKSGPRLMSIEEASAIGFSPPSATMVVAKVAQQKLPKRTYQQG
ncbi:hypothetical protein PF002_g18368 [Phytophthora fragariae]|uniref:Uncharacterized protein n=1 Tax=Phytophthora fragariae TaxID=53985 RepID=A0A6A3Y4K1_9STRA|nr:hypothetical protein PF002_g18368 [Phytophthora fragariae]